MYITHPNLLAMKLANKILSLSIIVLLIAACRTNRQTKQHGSKVLVFSKTNGFRHSSIPDGIKAIREIGASDGFEVYATEDSAYFTEPNLKQYQAVVFLNTTGNILSAAEKKTFENYIRHGGGFVGIHAASDTEYEWPFYEKMVGAQFLSHPEIQEADLIVSTKKHPATAFLPDIWHRKDEWYNFKNLNAATTLLLQIDETSYTGGKNGKNHPMSWYHAYEGGRAFYTALGHTEASYTEPLFIQHIAGGLRYAMGK